MAWSRAGFVVLGLAAAVCSCESDASLDVHEADGRGLGPNDFLPDASDDTTDDGDLGDLDGDLGDVPDVDDGIGRPCLLLQPGECPDGLKCAPTLSGRGVCQLEAETLVETGETCGQEGVDNCADGDLCIAIDELSGLRCWAICDASNGAQCAQGTACSAQLPLVEETVGICLPPPQDG